jgi:hypothetical protein
MRRTFRTLALGLVACWPVGSDAQTPAAVQRPRREAFRSGADAGLALAYTLTKVLAVEAGYNFVYVHQHEKSHEDNNIFELIDNGLRARLTLRFW